MIKVLFWMSSVNNSNALENFSKYSWYILFFCRSGSTGNKLCRYLKILRKIVD